MQTAHPVKKFDDLFRPLSTIVCLLVLVVAGRLASPFLVSQVDPISAFQYVAFPIVAAFFLCFRVKGARLPRSVVLLSVAFVVCGAASTFTHLGARGNTVVIARLKDDTLQSRTSVLKEHLERSSPVRSPARYQQDPATPKDSKAVRQILETYPGVTAVVWGSSRWLQIDFQQSAPRFLSSFPEGSYGEFLEKRYGAPDLLIATGVERIGLSFEPATDTAKFISELLAIRNFQTTAPERHHDPEQRLRAVALLQAGWTSNAHRAYPQFHLGTLHLLDVLSFDEYSPGELRCAIRALSGGLVQLRPGDNTELKAALLNNLGVAYFVQGISERKPGARRLSKLLWKRSKKVRREKNLLSIPLKSPGFSRYNLKLLKSGVNPGKRHKHSERRRK